MRKKSEADKRLNQGKSLTRPDQCGETMFSWSGRTRLQAKYADRGKNMKKIAITAALALGFGALTIATSPADARVRVVVAPVGYVGYGYGFPYRPAVPFVPVNAARYVACRKKVVPGRFLSPALVFAIDNCYIGYPW
jgi:hypothetical protein